VSAMYRIGERHGMIINERVALMAQDEWYGVKRLMAKCYRGGAATGGRPVAGVAYRTAR